MATALDDLEEFVSCEVCNDKFEGRDPRSLPCLHAFCMQCIQEVYQTAVRKQPNKKGEMTCPKCQDTKPLPGDSVDKYPKYFQATQVTDILGDLKKQLSNQSDDDHGLCTVCQRASRSVKAYCFTCREAFCQQCLDVHESNGIRSDHTKVDVTPNSIHALVCADHDEMSSAYCVDCCKQVCRKCELMDHASHGIHKFCIFQDDDGVEHLEERLCLHTKEIDEQYDELLFLKKQFTEAVKTVYERATVHKEELIRQIEDQYQDIADELEAYKQKEEGEMLKKKKSIERAKMSLVQIEISSKKIIKPNPTFTEISIQKRHSIIDGMIKNALCEQIDIGHPELCDYVPVMTDIVVGTLEFPELSCSDSGAISVSNSPGQELPQESLPDAQMDTGHQPLPAPTRESLLDPLWHVAVQSQSIHTLAFIPQKKGTPNILAMGEHGCVCLSMDGSVLPVPVDLSDIQEPLLIATELTTSSRLAIVYSSKTRLGTVYRLRIYEPDLKSYSSYKIDMNTSSVTFTADGGVLIGTSTQCLMKYTAKGQKLWKIKVQIKCNSLSISYIQGVESILIANGTRIVVYSENGKRIAELSYTTVYQFPPSIMCFCTDSMGNYLVVDASNNIIRKFSRKGRYMADIGRLKGSPAAMCLYEDTFLAVGTHYSGLFGFLISSS